jgi:hypothetical protein
MQLMPDVLDTVSLLSREVVSFSLRLSGVQPRIAIRVRERRSMPLRVKLLGGNGSFCFEMVYQLQLSGEEASVVETELLRKTISSVSSPSAAEHASG